MKVYQTTDIRNIGLIGGAKSGKTTLAEDMLFEGGVINRKGSVDDKNTVSDYRQIELERQNSISSTVMYSEVNNKKVNIIDTPGMDDFIGEVVSTLKVVDSAVMVVNAMNGVEVGTEVTGRLAETNNVPLIFAMNHLEHENSNFDETFEKLKDSFGGGVTVIQYPVNAGVGFNSVIDLLKMKMFRFADDGQAELLDIPDDEKAKAEEMQAALIEDLASSDESLMEKFFDKGTLSEEEISGGLKEGIKSRSVFPVLCINAKQNMGVARLLEFICNNAPAPNEMPAVTTVGGEELSFDPEGPAAAFVFKTVIESHLGEVTFYKLYSGEIKEGMDLMNARSRNKERITQIYTFAGKNREKLEKIVAGDIGAFIKLKDTVTNDTLSTGGKELQIKPIDFPEPKFRVAVKAKNQADDEKLGLALNEIHQTDPTVIANYYKELKQLILQGQGELHLNIVKWHLENLEKIEVEYLPPKIQYRETITRTSQATYQHKKQSGGAGQFGEVHMIIEPYEEGMPEPSKFKLKQTQRKSSVNPLSISKGDTEITVSVRGKEEISLEWGGKLIFYNCIVGGAIDARFLPAIQKGLMERMEEGPLTGSYARDIRVMVYDGKMHSVDSNEISFKIAGKTAFSMAFKEAGPKILEPIYDLEVIVPEDKMGGVMTDLQSRRAIIMGMEGGTIKAKVPLAEMNRYSTALSSLTSGRATYSIKFAEYAPVPTDIQEKLLKAYEEQQKEED
ncbi:MAG: elongation factor G [Bacteroidales bacterium]|nr:elongation factor G [Bacteroidales bacterium]MCF8344914.1 elongation factor G [Bacteroidales bacterium]MCF8376843.1 elongation factor G [Bacteroidales bacterium]MCF8400750.1 elongation factor G [Bacteroidales bacterium]